MPPDVTDEQWFDAVFTAHGAAVHRYFLRRAPAQDAEDLTAEVLATAWRRRDDVPRGHELPWLYRTAGYVLANHRRKHRAEPVDVTQTPLTDAGADPAGQATEAQMVRHVLAGLRPREREVLMLHAWEGLDGAQLAEVLGLSRGGAAAALSRARERLRQIWGEVE